MPKTKLSRLEKIDPRKAWKHEAGDFTPWLSKPENLALLGDALGLAFSSKSASGNKRSPSASDSP